MFRGTPCILLKELLASFPVNLHAKMARPIYNDTLESYVWSNMNKISMLFCSFTMFIIICEFSVKVACTFLLYNKKQWRNSQKLTLFEYRKQLYLPHFWSDQGFKGTVVNQALQSFNGGSLDTTLTVPLKQFFFHI